MKPDESEQDPRDQLVNALGPLPAQRPCPNRNCNEREQDKNRDSSQWVVAKLGPLGPSKHCRDMAADA